MSKFEAKPMTGVLFSNAPKQKETHPDWKGSMLLDDGRKIWLAGWVKTSKDGTRLISLALEHDKRDNASS